MSHIHKDFSWLGAIPTHWQVLNLRQILTACSEKNHPDMPLLSVVREKGVIVRNIDDKNHNYVPDDLSNYKLVKRGQFAVNKMKAWQGSYGVSQHDGIVSPAYFVFNINHDMNHDFFDKAIRSKIYVNYFGQASDGIRVGQWDLSMKRLRDIPFCLPPREEQEQIVRFLDWKVSAIDKLIATKKHQLCSLTALNSTMEKNLVLLGFDAAYPKNPPSVDWKENIPAHWKIRPLKRIFKILSGATPKSEIPEYWDGNIAWITPADYKTQDKYISHGSRNITEAGYTSCSTNMIPRGSIIFSKRAPIGTVAINDIELCTNQGCLSCIPIKDASATYYYYLMSCFTDVFEMNASGTTFKEISATTFGNMKVPFPPINEQKEIAAYLDARHTKYVRFAETTQKEIIVLNELKTRLISDAVTGKIDVRSIKLPNFAKEE